MFRTLQQRIAIPFVLLVLVTMLALGAYLSTSLRQDYLDSVESNLTHQTRLVADILQEPLKKSTPSEQLDGLARRWAGFLGARNHHHKPRWHGDRRVRRKTAPAWTTTTTGQRLLKRSPPVRDQRPVSAQPPVTRQSTPQYPFPPVRHPRCGSVGPASADRSIRCGASGKNTRGCNIAGLRYNHLVGHLYFK